MQLRLASFHLTPAFEALLGIHHAGPGGSGETVSTWRMSPGRCPRAYGLHPWGEPGVISVVWDAARPVIWDVDLPAGAEGGVAVFCSGLLAKTSAGWRYFEPPDRDPLLLAGVTRGTSMSIVVRTALRFPVVLPESHATAWIAGDADRVQLLRSIEPSSGTWFRSWLVADPGEVEDDSSAIVRQLLD